MIEPKVTVTEPIERMVVIKLAESDAYVLNKILSYAYQDSIDNAQGAFLDSLRQKLMDVNPMNNGGAAVNHTTIGIRVYDGNKEW